MAHASWLVPSKQSGSGNDTVNFSADAIHTGRVARSTIATVKGQSGNVQDVPITVTQTAKPEFASFNNSTASVVKTGGTLTLEGYSNSSKLTFSKGTDNIGITLPSTYTAGGSSVNNGAAISGDPGAAAQFAFAIQLTVPANPSAVDLTCQIVIEDNAGHTNVCTITLAAGDATLSVSPTTIEIPWDASTSASVAVTSNTNWIIE